jgi:CBS domain-containing protein
MAERTIENIMSRDVQSISPTATVQEAARAMREHDVGSLPVCQGETLVGVITDRDIAIRGVADACDPKTTDVARLMSGDVVWSYEDTPLNELADKMKREQLRRIPIVDHAKKLVGIVALADIAQHASDDEKAKTLEGVSGKN